MKRRNIDYFKALAYLSRSICILQLVPYHSKAFGLPKRIVKQLASTTAVIKFVHDVLIPEVDRGKTLLLVARKSKVWDIKERKNIIVYNGPESRAGYISPKSRGGKALARFLRN